MKVRRGKSTDEYRDGSGEAAVLIDGRVLVLSPLATRLLALIGEGWTDVDGLAASLAAAVGPPTDGRSAEKATADLVRELAADGVVEVRDAEDRPNG